MHFFQCLLLSQRAIGQDTSIGHLVNLMTNDVSRFDDATIYYNYLWVSPIQVAITTTILYFVLGSSCFVGLLIIFLLTSRVILYGFVCFIWFLLHNIGLYTVHVKRLECQNFLEMEAENCWNDGQTYSDDERNCSWNTTHKTIHLGEAFFSFNRLI